MSHHFPFPESHLPSSHWFWSVFCFLFQILGSHRRKGVGDHGTQISTAASAECGWRRSGKPTSLHPKGCKLVGTTSLNQGLLGDSRFPDLLESPFPRRHVSYLMTTKQLQTHKPLLTMLMYRWGYRTRRELLLYCWAPASLAHVYIDLHSCWKYLGESQMGGRMKRVLKYSLYFSTYFN